MGCFFGCWWKGKGTDVIEENCFNFLCNLAKELAADFQTQFDAMETFARWNLPEEIALEWLDAEGMLQILKEAKCGTTEELEILELIIGNFNAAFDQSLSHVWTYDAMQNDVFWLQQRNLAQKFLNLCNAS